MALRILAVLGIQSVCAYDSLGGYNPASDVLEHAQIALDIAAFNNAIKGDPPNYAAANNVYMYGGGNSCKSTDKTRKMEAFSTRLMVDESFAQAFYDSGLATDFWDTEIQAALGGTGKYAGASHTKRVTSAKKCILGLVTYYAAHELEAAIQKAAADGASDSGSGHAWDEGWGFYYGVDGTTSPWEVAKKRDANFADGAVVHTSILPYFNKGLIAMRADGYSDADAKEARDVIYKMWAITYLRAAYKYLEVSESSYSDKAHAEGYAYYMAIDGWIADKNAVAAKTMRDALEITKTSIQSGTYCAAKAAMEAAYPAIGIDCAMMGTWGDAEITCSTPCDAATVQLPAGGVAIAAVNTANVDKACPMKLPTAVIPENQVCEMGCLDIETESCDANCDKACCDDHYAHVEWASACNCKAEVSSSTKLHLSLATMVYIAFTTCSIILQGS
jgi:hypothetical protein